MLLPASKCNVSFSGSSGRLTLVGSHGISWSPSGAEAYITNSQDPTGSISVVREVFPGDWQEVKQLASGLFPNGITTRFGRNQNQ